MKKKPTRFAGWVGRISLSPYPHAGIGQQQHIAPAAEVGNIALRIGARNGGCQTVAGCLSFTGFTQSSESSFLHRECALRSSVAWAAESSYSEAFHGKQHGVAMTQWDVFSSKPLEGNSLAVFSDARGLSDAEMQAIAKEMNLSETTFIFPRDAEIERERGVRVRIFTVQEELPFAGHPTLGTAFALRGDSGAKEITLDLNVGKVPVRFEDAPGQPAFGEMTQIDPVFGMRARTGSGCAAQPD